MANKFKCFELSEEIALFYYGQSNWYIVFFINIVQSRAEGGFQGFQESPTKIISSKQSPGHSAAHELFANKNTASI